MYSEISFCLQGTGARLPLRLLSQAEETDGSREGDLAGSFQVNRCARVLLYLLTHVCLGEAQQVKVIEPFTGLTSLSLSSSGADRAKTLHRFV